MKCACEIERPILEIETFDTHAKVIVTVIIDDNGYLRLVVPEGTRTSYQLKDVEIKSCPLCEREFKIAQ